MAKTLGKNSTLGLTGVLIAAEYHAVHHVTKRVVEYFKDYLWTPVKDWAPTVVATGVTALTFVFVGNKLGFGGSDGGLGGKGLSQLSKVAESRQLVNVETKEGFVQLVRNVKAALSPFILGLDQDTNVGNIVPGINQELAKDGIEIVGQVGQTGVLFNFFEKAE